MLLICSFNIFV